MRSSPAGWRSTRTGAGADLEVWIDRCYVPAGYGWSFPADSELRSASARSTRASTSRSRPTGSPGPGRERVRYQGNWIPHKLRDATEDGIFFAGDSAGHCLPLTAEGIRTALYFGVACGRELRGGSRGASRASRRSRRYHAFSAATNGSSSGCAGAAARARASHRGCWGRA